LLLIACGMNSLSLFTPLSLLPRPKEHTPKRPAHAEYLLPRRVTFSFRSHLRLPPHFQPSPTMDCLYPSYDCYLTVSKDDPMPGQSVLVDAESTTELRVGGLSADPVASVRSILWTSTIVFSFLLAVGSFFGMHCEPHSRLEVQRRD
jgi:hypothetical protein